ncbi:MAG TPA: PRC-barrel domain-containing protein [Verrucomicrobiae bacterium]|jgi:sporulation protein YlmC with PRC-barrel domain|nr:PRC-barrel domain-containing protein [Verrucomicrobiae bacterium]
MKQTILLRTLACCVAGSLFAGSAIAQQSSGDTSGAGGTGNLGSAGQPPPPGYSTLSQSSSSRSMRSERLSQLMGATVKDQQGNTIGQINDFVVNPMSGRIQFAVISLNDQSGKLAAVPWQLVRPGADPTTCSLSVSKDKLDNAQTFDASSWPDFSQPSTSQQIYSHFGMQGGRSGWGNEGGTGNQNGTGSGQNQNGTGSSGYQNQNDTGTEGYHHGTGTPGTGEGTGSTSTPRNP